MNFKKQIFLNLLCFFFLLFGNAKNGISQTDDRTGKIIAFHPSVGNSLDLSEKKEFGVFTEYNDSLFESAQLVKYSIDRYSVLVKTKNGQSFERPISIKELDAIYAGIEKLKPLSSTVETDDYVVEKPAKEKEIKKSRNDTAYIIGEITLQILFVFLEVLAHSY